MELPSSSNIYWLMLLYGIQGVPYGFQVAFLPILLHAGGASLTKVSLLRVLNLPWMLKLLWVPMVMSSASIKRPLAFSLVGLSVIFTVSSMISAQSAWILSSVLLAMNILASVQDIAVDAYAIQNLKESEMGMGNAVQVVAYKIGAMFGGGVLTWASQFCSWSLLMMCVASVYLVTALVIYLGLPAFKSDLETDKKESDENMISNTPFFVNNGFKSSYNNDQNKKCLSRLSADQNQTSTYSIDKNIFNQAVLPAHRYNLRSSYKNQRKYYSPSNLSSDNRFGTAIKHRVECIDNTPSERKTEVLGSRKADNISPLQNGNQRTVHLCEDFTSVLKVPGTPWLLLYLLIYKLGEQGAISMFPLYLFDSHVTTNQVAFWTGLLAQWVSITGSLLGGWLLNHNTKRRSLSIELGSLCFWRFIAVSILSFMIWQDGNFGPLLLCIPLYLVLLLGGAITTATFTTMMMTSQRASQPAVQTLHHTTMATAEVLGKVTFTSLAGLLVDKTGYVAGFISFALLSVLPILPLYKITIAGTSTIKGPVHTKF